MTIKALKKYLSLHDFERAAKRRLPKPLFAYVSGAVEDEQSVTANRSAFRNYAFKPRVLVNVSHVDASISLFGTKYTMPVGIAPMGLAAMTGYRGDVSMAVAAKKAGALCIMSGSSLIRLEEVMDAAPGTWFQAYLPGKEEQIDALIDRVRQAGVETLVLTVDTPVAANRENNIRSGFSTPLRPSLSLAWQGITHPKWLLGTFGKTLMRHGMPHFENNYATRGTPIMSSNVLRDFSDRGHLSWEHIDRVRKMWNGPLVIKGILNVEDMLRARNVGADAVIVSNHGGRQLDGSVAPLLALPEMIEAAGEFPLMLDSGVRRGTDVLKALALGARAVWIGRPFNYAATVGGEQGVAHALELIKQEVLRDMALLGVTRVGSISRELICTAG
ncbi:alpha-hydroxy acid oxidase [Achromobacter animicus]|uniref:alpha-hydroxy acid oxidase n=1 Tax=Achromobacter animicus TaxID=1389935 RepID=UPI0028B01BB5|nr:alpha-hydroxy acid oxidase [Achromobacter animicus]